MAGRGKKDCPNCNTEIGGRTLLCDCGYHFPSKEIRKDLVEEKNKKKEKTSLRPGIKICTNCNTEIGVRTVLCKHCGFHFPTGEIRKDLLKEKEQKKESPIYTSGGAGRKECPQCHVFVGAVTKECPKCNFDFVAAKKEKEEIVQKESKKEEVHKPEVDMTLRILKREELKMLKNEYEEEVECKTPDEHADRILGYGQERAQMLLNMHRWGTTWSHVNWKKVEAGLNDYIVN